MTSKPFEWTDEVGCWWRLTARYDGMLGPLSRDATESDLQRALPVETIFRLYDSQCVSGIADASPKLQAALTKIAELQSELGRLGALNDKYQADAGHWHDRYTHATDDTLRHERDCAIEAQKRAEAKFSMSPFEYSRLQAENEKLRAENEKLKGEHTELFFDADSAEKELAEARARIAELESINDGLDMANQALQHERELIQARLHGVLEALTRLGVEPKGEEAGHAELTTCTYESPTSDDPNQPSDVGTSAKTGEAS